MTKIKGLVTGIGSLPHKDAGSALDLVFEYCPQIPFWPQLPKRDVREGMIAQFSENLPCLQVSGQGLFLNPEDKEKKLEVFYEHIIANDAGYFAVSADFALGLHAFYQRLKKTNLKDIEFIKLHLTGPFSFAAGIKDEKGVALLHDPVFMQAILKGLGMKALWQINLFREFGKKMILFLDEPYLGCFGSAYTPINREDVVSALSDLAKDIKSDDVLLGVHCCGNTDWSIFTDVPAVDIINFDAFSYLDKLLLYADNLSAFFKRQGILCWGIAPTTEFSGKETPDSLVKTLISGIDILSQKGLDKKLLLENLLISPACGLGTLDVSKSYAIFKLLSETSLLLKKAY
ncbi:MAG: methionine synthase [Candidatus Omnitrophica bacterium]|nr:methionine synthase [Candidatus Omnitrophota bacterium]